jgi:hypothetical protein
MFLVLISVRGWVNPRATMRPEGLSMKNSNDTIGNRSRDLPVCSAVPQTLRHRVPPHTMGTGSFPGVKRPGLGVHHPPTSSSEIKEGVELYLYCPSGPSWPVLGENLTFIFTFAWLRRDYIKLPLLPNSPAVKHFHTNLEGCEVFAWYCIYQWVAGLVVTGRIRYIGGGGWKSSFRTGSCISPSYSHAFFLIASLRRALIKNTKMALRFIKNSMHY